MRVQARATDTGGNAALSNTLVFEAVTDTVAPTIVAVDPADGATAPEGLQQVTVRFSEALAPASVSASTFRVATGGQTVAPLAVDLLSEGRSVQLRFAGLAAGDYQLVIDADAPLVCGRGPDELLDAIVFGGSANPVRDVFVGGRQMIDQGKHAREETASAAYRAAAGRLASSL